MQSYDVVIAGGGLAGLTLARQLHRALPDASLLVLEKQPHPVPEAAHKVGESSVEVGAWYLEQTLGLGDHIRQHQLPKLGLRFFFTEPEHTSLEQGLELGVRRTYPTPSYQIDRGRLENHLAEDLQQQGITFRSGARITELVVSQGKDPHLVQWRADAGDHRAHARWLIDAGGRAALLKRKLNLAQSVDHHVNAVWFRLNCRIEVDAWRPTHVEGPADGQRWLSTNHLMGQGYWVWLIPLASGATSVGIVADPEYHPLSTYNSFEKALDWLDTHEPICGEALRSQQQHLMDFRALKHFSHGCRQVFSAERWALTGEAGVFLDPFYSPGSDFIAISNTMITAMIERDLAGKPIGGLTQIYEQLYQMLFENTMGIYRGQYAQFGNPKAIVPKILWDYAVYWSFTAFIFIQGRLTDVATLAKIRDFSDDIGTLNHDMQAWFLTQPATPAGSWTGFLDQGELELLARLNGGLSEQLDRQGFIERMEQHLVQLRQLAEEIKHPNRQQPGWLAPLWQQLAPADQAT